MSEVALDCLSQAGLTTVLRFDDKVKIVEELCHFFVIDKVRSVLEEFKEGLCTLNILALIKAHPEEFEMVFCYHPTPLTANAMDLLFVPTLAEEGTTTRDKQEIIVMNWRDYLLDCQGSG